MPSPLQVLANRRNALQSTGPRTPRGKAMSARNAVKHAVHSWHPVLLHGESKSDWEKFARLVIDDLFPHGPVEAMWAGRIALHLWRLQRSMDARKILTENQWLEAQVTAHETPWWQHQRSLDESFPTSMHVARTLFATRTAECKLLRRVLALPPGPGPEADRLVSAAVADSLIEWAAAHLRVEAQMDQLGCQNMFPGLGAIDPQLDTTDYQWTVGMVRDGLCVLAGMLSESLDQLSATLSPALEASHRIVRSNFRRAEREMRRQRRCSAARSLDALRPLERFDTTLERSLARCERQLRRLQAARLHTPSKSCATVAQNVVKMGFVQVETPEK